MLEALFAKEFGAYIDAASAGEALWLFVHVPKTAGSSLTAEARALLKPSYSIEVDHTDASTPQRAKFDRAVADFITLNATRHFRFCRGHITAKQVDVIRAAVPDVRCFTMLRDPLSRIVSDYRYQRSPMNTARDNFLARTPTFEAYVERKHVHNKTALNLAPRDMAQAGDVAACVDYIMKSYAFVGLQEMYPLSLRLLTLLMGEQRVPEAKVRVNKANEDSMDLSPEMERSLRALNAVDIGIYQAFQARWQGVRDALDAYLRAHHPQSTAKVAQTA